MSAARGIVQDTAGLTRNSRSGDGVTLKDLLLSIIATDAAQTLAWGDCAGGAVQFSSFSAGRVVTTDTAANILAANPNMDIGDTIMIFVSALAAFAATWGAGVGVTLAGRATTPASSTTPVIIKKLSATTVSWTVL